jgi:hypothetical protein
MINEEDQKILQDEIEFVIHNLERMVMTYHIDLLEYKSGRSYKAESVLSLIQTLTFILSTAMYKLQEKENMPMDQRELMSAKFGKELRRIIKIYTDIETDMLYNSADKGNRI